jgi:hypothetical protein
MSTEPTREPSLGATVEDSTRKAKRAAKQAKDAADEAGNVLGGLFEGVVDALGGVSRSSLAVPFAYDIAVDRVRQPGLSLFEDILRFILPLD